MVEYAIAVILGCIWFVYPGSENDFSMAAGLFAIAIVISMYK